MKAAGIILLALTAILLIGGPIIAGVGSDLGLPELKQAGAVMLLVGFGLVLGAELGSKLGGEEEE